MKLDAKSSTEERFGGAGGMIFRAVIALNFIRFALSFWPRFEGTAHSIGIADYIFPYNSWTIFRLDFDWLLGSSAIIFVSIFYFIVVWKSDPEAKANLLLSCAWLVAFCIYVARIFTTGLVDFG